MMLYLPTIEPERMTIHTSEHEIVELHEVARYKAVVERCLDCGRVRALAGLLEHHRKVFGSPLADQKGGLLVGYETVDAIRDIAQHEPDLARHLALDFVSNIRLVPVGDEREAATLIRATYLSWDLPDEKKNWLIADEILQDLEWIASHRGEIDSQNPTYQGQQVRPSANRIARRTGVSNKRVERVYLDSTYGLRKYAKLPSLGLDGRLQAGVEAPRGRRSFRSTGRSERPQPAGSQFDGRSLRDSSDSPSGSFDDPVGQGATATGKEQDCGALRRRPNLCDEMSIENDDAQAMVDDICREARPECGPCLQPTENSPKDPADAVTEARDAIPAAIVDGSADLPRYRPDPIYELGRHLALLLRDGCEETGPGCDPRSEPPGHDMSNGDMVVWLARVEAFLRGAGRLAERRRLYQTIVFLGIES
jgi:hypothetical protein